VFRLPDPPSEPKDVEIGKFTKNSVQLKWKPPASDGGKPIKGALPIFDHIKHHTYASNLCL
jgi:hypothetical protein